MYGLFFLSYVTLLGPPLCSGIMAPTGELAHLQLSVVKQLLTFVEKLSMKTLKLIKTHLDVITNDIENITPM